MLKRFGDTPMTRRALLQAHGKATAEGLTPETYEKHLAIEFASWVGKEPDGGAAAAQSLDDVAATISTPSPAGVDQPAGGPHPGFASNPVAPTVVTPPPLPPPPTIPPAPTASPTPPPLPRTTAALTAALAAVASVPIAAGAGRPHPEGLPTATSNGPNQVDWEKIGERIGDGIRRQLDAILAQQTGTPGPLGAGGPQNRAAPVTLTGILNSAVQRLPQHMRVDAAKAIHRFGKSRLGKFARGTYARAAKSRLGGMVTRGLAARASSGLAARGGAMAGGRLGMMAGAAFGPIGAVVGAVLGATVAGGGSSGGGRSGGGGVSGLLSFLTPTGSPNNGYLDQAASQIPGIGSLTKFAKTVDNATDRLAHWNQQIGQFSAAMSVAISRREIGDIYRSQVLGDRLAGSAAGLVESENRRKNAELEYKELAAVIENGVTQLLNLGVANVLEFFKPYMEAMAKFFNIELAKDTNNGMDMESILQNALEEDRRLQDAAHAKLEQLKRGR